MFSNRKFGTPSNDSTFSNQPSRFYSNGESSNSVPPTPTDSGGIHQLLTYSSDDYGNNNSRSSFSFLNFQNQNVNIIGNNNFNTNNHFNNNNNLPSNKGTSTFSQTNALQNFDLNNYSFNKNDSPTQNVNGNYFDYKSSNYCTYQDNYIEEENFKLIREINSIKEKNTTFRNEIEKNSQVIELMNKKDDELARDSKNPSNFKNFTNNNSKKNFKVEISASLVPIFQEMFDNLKYENSELIQIKRHLEALYLSCSSSLNKSQTKYGQYDEEEISHKFITRLEKLIKENKNLKDAFEFGKLKQKDLELDWLNNENKKLKSEIKEFKKIKFEILKNKTKKSNNN